MLGQVSVQVSQNGIEYEPLGMLLNVFSPLPGETAVVPSSGQAEGGYEIYLAGDDITGGSDYGMRFFKEKLGTTGNAHDATL